MDKKNIINDNDGQAMVEFVVVFPVLMSIIVVIIQMVLVINAVSLGNYAAFVAARSYAVHQRPDLAKKAAAIAYAPVSDKVPGETISGVPSLVFDRLAPFLSEVPGLDLLDLVERHHIASNRTRIFPFVKPQGFWGEAREVKVVEMTVEHNYPLWVFGIGWLLEPFAPQDFVRINGWPHLRIETKCAMGIEFED